MALKIEEMCVFFIFVEKSYGDNYTVLLKCLSVCRRFSLLFCNLIYAVEKILDKEKFQHTMGSYEEEMTSVCETNVNVSNVHVFEFVWQKYDEASKLVQNKNNAEQLRRVFLDHMCLFYDYLVCFASIESLQTIYQRLGELFFVFFCFFKEYLIFKVFFCFHHF